MIYKVLITTVASRSTNHVDINTMVIDFTDRIDAVRAIKAINEDQRDQKALALNFNESF
jgi:hypothetical protein